MTTVFPLAKKQWDSREGCEQLVDHWETSAGKHEAERIISELASKCPNKDSVVDLGCGPGRLVPWLSMFAQYQGFDWSEHMLSLAQQEWKSSEKRSFIQRNAFDGAPTRKWPDLLLCIDLSRHYSDPLAFLLTVAERWPAHYYIFSILHGGEEEELINGAVVSTKALNELQASYGEILEAVEQELPGNRFVRYLLIKRKSPEKAAEAKQETTKKSASKRGRPKRDSGV